ncbi:hypothetical protein TWF696_002698 [Orbilia brochopaga]|uniref:C2H2-type domain-containing protein n=1 Tax=Orbilia brochopaga TaxID=3140254 RepID=A0AAV9U2H1_9PEZI
MYRAYQENLGKHNNTIENRERYSNHHNNITDPAGFSVDPSSTGLFSNLDAENPWSSQFEDVSVERNTMNSDIQQIFPATLSAIPQLSLCDVDLYNQDDQGLRNPMDPERFEPWSSYTVLLESAELRTEEGGTLRTPWIYLWNAEEMDPDQRFSQISPEDVRLERARYVKNPEMQAARAFYNALQIMRRTIQANEAELSPHLRTHHEKTNCEIEMLLSFHEYDLHANECADCCSALANLRRQLPCCELGMRLAEKVFLAIDWYATATFGDYETVSLQVFDPSVRNLLLAFTQAEPTHAIKAEENTARSLQENAAIQTLAIESLGVISSFLGLEDKTSVIKSRHSNMRESPRANISGGRRDKSQTEIPSFLQEEQPDLLITDADLVVSKLDEYLDSPSKRRALRTRIGQQGMRSIRRLFNVSLHGYNSLERALGDRIEDKYDFYQNFPNHADLLSLGVQTFIELSSEKPSYPTALREVYSILHLCDSINKILPQRNSERRRRAESFTRELKDWRNIIETDGERSAFELIVQIRWPSQYLQFRRRPSLFLKSPSNKISQHLPPPEDRSETTTATSSDIRRGPQTASPSAAEESNPMAKALLWMQLFAGIVFTTIAAYFSLNHRMVNILVLYLTGGDSQILNSSQTIDNNSTHLPKNLAWISSSSIKFMDKTRRYIINKLRDPEYSIFSHVIDVAADSLSCGWISTIKGLESLLLQMAKLVECTKVEFQGFVEKVLDLCMICAANLSQYESHRIAPKGSDTKYNISYKESRVAEVFGRWTADDDEVPTEIPTLQDIMSVSPAAGFGSSMYHNDRFLGPQSPSAASLGSSRSLGHRIKSDFLDDIGVPVEDRLVSTEDMYFPERTVDQDLSGGPIAAYASMMNAPTMDPVLTIEHQDNLLALYPAHAHFPTPSSTKAYSHTHPPNMFHHTASNFDSFWNMNRAPVVVSSLPEHTGYYLAPNSGWHFAEDFLGSTSSPSNAYCQAPTSIPTSLPTAYPDNLKPLLTGSITASSISPYIQSAETPRFLPIAPTPPPPVPPPKPRKRRRSSSTKNEDDRSSGTGTGQPVTKRQKKTMLFKCPICKHDIAAPRMNLTRHIRSVHADSRTRRIECEWPGCATTFQAARKDNYRAHLRKHHEKLSESGSILS